MKRKGAAVLFSALVAVAVSGAAAQNQPQPQQQPQHRDLWIAKFTCDAKAASAVAAAQHNDAGALSYGNLFDHVTAFDTQATQPQGSWSLNAAEVDFHGGSTAERALVGFGSGRASLTMEYTLTDPTGKAVWTQKIKTKPSFWGSAGALGAVQNQNAAEDEQAQKLIAGLSSFFGVAPPGKSK